MKTTPFILFVVLCTLTTINAQAPIFSQFYANRVFLNPAYAGFDPGTTITLNHRSQSFGVPDGSFNTFPESYRSYSATVNMNLPCLFGGNFGLAVSAFHDETGFAPLEVSGGGFALSYNQRLLETAKRTKYGVIKGRLDLLSGFNFDFAQRRLSSDHLIYSDYLDPVHGLDDTVVPDIQMSSNWYPNMGSGFILRYFRDGKKIFKNRKHRARIHGQLYSLGMSFGNINRPEASLRESASDYQLPMRMTIHGGAAFFRKHHNKAQNRFLWSPQLRYDWHPENDLKLFTVGAYVVERAFYLGAFYQSNPDNRFPTLARNTQTLILNTGFSLKSFSKYQNYFLDKIDAEDLIFGISYDINLTGLKSGTTLGALEFNLRINFDSNKNKSCPIPGIYRLYNGECPVNF